MIDDFLKTFSGNKKFSALLKSSFTKRVADAPIPLKDNCLRSKWALHGGLKLRSAQKPEIFFKSGQYVVIASVGATSVRGEAPGASEFAK